MEAISAGEDDDQCEGGQQTGSYWAKTMRKRERDSLCLDNKLLQLIYSRAGRAEDETVGFAVGLNVPMQ